MSIASASAGLVKSLVPTPEPPPPVAPMIDLRALDVFMTVVEANGMTTAARRLGMTQSAVSQTIIGLEKSLGVVLFDRSLRPPALTAAGSVLLEEARPLLERAREIAHHVRQPAEAALPHLRLGMVDSIAATIGPDLIQALRNVALHWSVWSGLSPGHERALLAREVDMVIITGDALDKSDRLVHHPILTEPFFLAVPAALDAPVESLQELAERLDLIRYTARSLIGQQIERHLRRVRVEPPRRLEFDTADAVMAMVGAGIGWAVTTPLCFLQGRVHAAKVRCLPLPGPGFSRRLTLFARRNELGELPARVAGAATDILRDHCLPVLGEHAPWLVAQLRIGEPSARAAD